MINPKLFGILGHKISYSLSPYIFNSIFKREGLPYFYYNFDIAPNRLRQFVNSAKLLNISGFNVTIPFKRKIIKYLDTLDKSAKSIGAVNVVINDNGKLKGFNFDYYGIKSTIENQMKIQIKNRIIAVIGSGGSAQTIMHYLQRKQPEKVHLYNRNIRHGNRLAKEFEESLSIESAHISKFKAAIRRNEIYLVINATPVTTLHFIKNIPSGLRVFDLSYRPGKNLYSKNRNCRDGTFMLAAQASKSLEQMCGIIEPAYRIYKNLKRKFK